MRAFIASLSCAALFVACSSSSSQQGGPSASSAGISIPAACGSFSGTTGLYPDGGIELASCSEFYGISSSSNTAVNSTLQNGPHCPLESTLGGAACECLQVDPGSDGVCTLSVFYQDSFGISYCTGPAKSACSALPGTTTWRSFITGDGGATAAPEAGPVEAGPVEAGAPATASAFCDPSTPPWNAQEPAGAYPEGWCVANTLYAACNPNTNVAYWPSFGCYVEQQLAVLCPGAATPVDACATNDAGATCVHDVFGAARDLADGDHSGANCKGP